MTWPEQGQTLIEGVTLFDESRSGKALRVQFPDEEEPRWVPLSLISYVMWSGTVGGDKIKIATWWLRKEGLE